jgi:FlaA1/EpsC-like NDP-sugar epimerase
VITAVLGSVLDAGLVRRMIEQHKVQTIYHAAAYKHVPIVERNPAVGLENNTFGTMIVADAARDLGVERFVLVSTDKAVRPTNIMGASKRLAEHYLQSLAQTPDEANSTIFTMVRFGNVLDSSGSVVRLFREQIEKGGPVTVTHPDIIRYFMSIPEAAELVIQAGGMAKGGDVFVLDMGDPVKIDDLARTMIRLMGRTVKDERSPRGDISIVYTGLREGEKLYEELLIGDDTALTAHPRIRRSNEPFRSLAETNVELEALRAAILSRDIGAVHAVLLRSVEGYVPEPRAMLPPVSVSPERTLH